MSRHALWWVAKVLEGVGMVIVLVGVFISMSLGFDGDGLASMSYEFQGLFVGGALFLLGVLIERRVGAR
jgi:hypothetical protein